MQLFKKIPQLALILILCTFTLSSCEAIGSIFKAGVWSGVIIVVLVVALILYLISRGRK